MRDHEISAENSRKLDRVLFAVEGGEGFPGLAKRVSTMERILFGEDGKDGLIQQHSILWRNQTRIIAAVTWLAVTVQVPVTNADHTVTTNTVQKPVYSYGPGAGEQEIKDIGTAVGTPFGVGGLVGGALGLVFGAWRWAISNKTGATGATLAQEMETALEFMSTLPNGSVIRNQFTNWLQAHQAQTDTLQQVLGWVNNTVKNDNAQVAAQQISAAVAALTQTPPAKPA